jgi:glycosyltransferase involved in cell wall biosynthesis
MAGRRVLILTAARTPAGGVGRAVRALAEGMSRAGWDVRSSQESPGRVPRRRPGPLDGFREALRQGTDAYRLVRRHRPEVVSLHVARQAPLPSLLGAGLAGARRCYVTVHASRPLRGRVPVVRPDLWLAAGFIVPSRAMAEYQRHASRLPGATRVIADGVEAPAVTQTKAEARAALRLPVDGFVVATAARLQAGKGVDRLIRAVAKVSGCHLLVAGDGPERTRLVGLAAGLAEARERIHFTGWVEEGLGDVYAAADVFALPSANESFGLAYLEAALCGLALVAPEIAAVREALADAALFVAPDDVAGLATALVRLRDAPDLRRRLADAAAARARGKFTVEQMVEGYAALFAGGAGQG